MTDTPTLSAHCFTGLEGPEGLRVGQPLKEFQGVLKGVPIFFGAHNEMLVANGIR